MEENKQQKEIREITEKLEQGVQELFESEKYREFLKTMSKFHNYSLNNTLLIAMQKPDATLVAGYAAWQKNHERHVMRGEKGIRIFAPAPYKVKQERDKIDPATQKPVLDEHNHPVREVVEVKIPAYKVVSVFDISQTEGKEIPSLGAEELLGDVEDYVYFFDALERSCPVPIGFEAIEGGAKGYYHQADKRIALNEGMSETQNVKTLIHEMAHQKLHAVENVDKDLKLSRSAKEVEAESIAYVICQHYGIDTSEYSFGYVAGWSEGRDTPELKASLDRIRKAANEMINEIDSHIAEINLELQSEHSEHRTCYLKISSKMGSEYAVDRIAGTPEQIEAALKEIKEAGNTEHPIENIEEFLESKGIPVLPLGSSSDDEPIRLVHPEYEYDADNNEIYRDGAALGREMPREGKEGRYSVTETSDAFAPGDDFAVWDNEKEDYVKDEDGTVQTFPTQEDAERFLVRGMEKPEKEAAISFYVAECMEHTNYGTCHEGLTMKRALEIYERIPADRMMAGKGIGFNLQDGSIYSGRHPLMILGEIQDEAINYITHYRNSPLVQEAIKECREELNAGKGERRSEIEAGAYRVGEEHYLSMQLATDESWDYTLYDKDFKEIDGGQIGDGSISFADARNDILESYGLMQEHLRSMNPEELENKARFQEAMRLHEQGLVMDDYVLRSEKSMRIEEAMEMAFVAMEDFSTEQMDVIYEAADLDVPLGDLLNPELPAYQMQFALDRMKEGCDVTQILIGGKQISLVEKSMTQEELSDIAIQINYAYIPKMLYTPEQWKEIENGMKHKLDVSVYTNPEYTAGQMKEIRIGMDKGIDVTAFASPEFSDRQMREIRRGIEAGVDVSAYARQDMSAGDMRKAFFALKDGTNALENEVKTPEPDKDSGMYRYYSTQRPVMPGTFPGKPVQIHNFDSRESICGGQMQAWGYLEYAEPLTEKQMSDYELKPAVKEAAAKEQPSFSMQKKETGNVSDKKPSVMENLRKKQAQIANADVAKSRTQEKGARE